MRIAVKAAISVLLILGLVALSSTLLSITDTVGLRAVLQASGRTLCVALGVVLIALGVGTGLGLGAGASRSWDMVLARCCEVGRALPAPIVVALLCAVWPRWATIATLLLLGTVRALGVAELVRGEVIALATCDFVTAARALGLSDRATVAKHLAPHALPPALAHTALSLAWVTSAEASVRLIGAPGPATWGALLVTPATSVAARVSILLLVGAVTLALSTLGGALAAGPRQRQRLQAGLG